MAVGDKTITKSTTVTAVPLPGGMAPVGPPAVTITTSANLLQEYVNGGSTFWVGQGIHVQPWNFDDLTSDFGDMIYERMLWDPFIKSCHTIYKKSVMAEGHTVTPAPMDPIEKWRLDRANAIANHATAQKAKEKAIAGAKPDPLHVSDPNAPTPAPLIPEAQPKIPDKPRPVTPQQSMADECVALLDYMDPPFTDVLNDMLDAAAFGNRVAEIVWQYIPASASGKFAGKYVIKSLKVKPRRTLAYVVDRFLNIVGMLNIRPGIATPALVGQVFSPISDADKNTILPREKFAILTHEPKDSDPRGTSYLRPAYTAWWGKMQLYPEYLRYLSQFGSPSLVGFTSPNASTVATPTGAISAQQNMVNTLSTFRGGTAMAFPYGAVVRTLLEGVASRSFTEDFAHFNNEMAIGILSMNPNGPKEGVGTAKVHQDTMSQIILASKASVERMIVRDLFTPYVVYNHGDDQRDLIPGCSLGGGNQPDLAAEMASAAQAGYTITPSMFPGVDARFGMPQRDPEEIAALSKRIIAGADPTPAPSDTQRPPSGPPGQDNATK